MNHESATDRELERKLADLTTTEKAYDARSLAFNGWWVGDDCPDYCTDWNATIPLAIESGVSYVKIGDNEYSAHDGYWHHGGHIADYTQEVIDKNPLRAIVICLIKVLEAKQ